MMLIMPMRRIWMRKKTHLITLLPPNSPLSLSSSRFNFARTDDSPDVMMMMTMTLMTMMMTTMTMTMMMTMMITMVIITIDMMMRRRRRRMVMMMR